MPLATPFNNPTRLSIPKVAFCRLTCSRKDSGHNSNAMNTFEFVIPQQWKNGTFGDWFNAVINSTSRSTNRTNSRPFFPGGLAMRFTATACLARDVCRT